MKKIGKMLMVLLVLLLLYPVLPRAAGASLDETLTAEAAVVMDADSGRVLYAKNPRLRQGMASTTKIMTSLLCVEYGAPDFVVTASREAVQVEGTSIGLKEGDRISLDTLLYGMLLESGNDAANVTAQAIAGSVAAFPELMNRKAAELGMKDTCFKNPSGLPAEGHVSTAYDMALLAREAICNPAFRRVCATARKRVSYGFPEYERTFSNHNRLLSSYEGMIGVKTGFTKASGRCLVTAAVRDGVTLIAVTLRDPNDYADHVRLLDYGFSVTRRQKLVWKDAYRVRVVGSDTESVSVKPGKALSCTLGTLPEEACRVQVYLEPFLYAPVKKGQIVGKAVCVSEDGTVLGETPLISAGAAERNFSEREAPQGLWERFRYYLKEKYG